METIPAVPDPDLDPSPDTDPQLAALAERFSTALDRLAAAPASATFTHLAPVMDSAQCLLATPGGVELLAVEAHRFDAAGLFAGSDWAQPELLKPAWVTHTFRSGDPDLITIECLSELRLLAIANGRCFHPLVGAEQARLLLTKILAFNLQLLMGMSDEATRALPEARQDMLRLHLDFLAARIGFENVLDPIVDEVWRIQHQRPIKVDASLAMIDRLAYCLFNPEVPTTRVARGAEGLISAVYGPTRLTAEDPGVAVYQERLDVCDPIAAEQEALSFARAMHDTGLVSPYHAVFLRYAIQHDNRLLTLALGLSTTGIDSLHCYRDLVVTLIERYIDVGTHQAIYGLAMMLERAVLHQPGIGAGLWRQMAVQLHASVIARLSFGGDEQELMARLMCGLISVLGQPVGLAQGNNPACQATRAISMWACDDAAYLMQLVFYATRDDDLVMHFEGQGIASASCNSGLVGASISDLDPISLLLVPHLDRIYIEMGRRVAGRGDDPHRWINPEFHGWHVHRGFALAVDLSTGKVPELAAFVRSFLARYHPYYNGNTPVVHPQPAGIAVTDGHARYIGWHAITILRVALDLEGVMRVYFFNPNMDSGQDWGHGVLVATEGHGEQHGESSLPIEQFAARLYLFHYDPAEPDHPQAPVPEATVQAIVAAAHASWAVDRQ